MDGQTRDSRAVGYFDPLAAMARRVAFTLSANAPATLDAAVEQVIVESRARTARGNKLMFVGNGSSAAIEYGFVEVMHLAIFHRILDFSMNLSIGANAMAAGNL